MDKSDNEHSANGYHQYKSRDWNTSTKNIHEKNKKEIARSVGFASAIFKLI